MGIGQPQRFQDMVRPKARENFNRRTKNLCEKRVEQEIHHFRIRQSVKYFKSTFIR